MLLIVVSLSFAGQTQLFQAEEKVKDHVDYWPLILRKNNARLCYFLTAEMLSTRYEHSDSSFAFNLWISQGNVN